MEVEITVKNYRCFSDMKPAQFKIIDGYCIGFIGINNAGKSSLLKFFYELRHAFNVQLGHSLPTLIKTTWNINFSLPFIADPEEVFCNSNDRDMEIRLRWVLAACNFPNTTLTMVSKITRLQKQLSNKIYINNSEVKVDELTQINQDEYQFNEFTFDSSPLRETLKALGNTLYIGPFRNAINVGTESNYYDINVGQSFISQWRSWKTGNAKKFNEAANDITENIRKIFEFSQLEINSSPDDKTLQLFINRKSYRISELGSGLTQFFLVLANAAMHTPSFILIDEPETNLHPSLQLDFLTTLASYAKNGLLFATHSIGLARSSANIIYSVCRNIDDLSEVAEYDDTPRLSELLGELSFSGYKELGFDKILMVEGSTETKTIQQFLRLYGNKDHRIVLLPLGGGQLINKHSEAQLEEIKRISNNIHALIDSERTAEDAPLESGRADFKKICENMDIECHILERRATENYLSDNAIKKVKGQNYRALTYFERLKDLPNGWAKADNWRIAREMTLEELELTDLGLFLKRL